MTREKEIGILMADGCTKRDARRHLDRGSLVFDDFEEHFDAYMDEWDINEEERAQYKAMITDKKPMTDWGIVEDAGKTYYILYVL